MNEPLISIVIISYNSEKYIVEALESARKQIYSNIELIISDDGSTDLTIQIIERWIYKNQARFFGVKLIKSDENTGITHNLNRGVMSAKGEYIKLIAADDILLENCATDLLDFVQKKNIPFCFSRVLPFSNSKNNNIINDIVKKDEKNYDFFFNKSLANQYYALLKLTIPLSIIIGGFYKKSVFEKIGYFDETYEMMEDYPFMISLSKLGYRFELLNKYTSKYRIRDTENSRDFKKSKRFVLHYHNLRDFRKTEIIPLMKKEKMYISIIYLKVLMQLLHIEFNCNNEIVRLLMAKLRSFKNLLMKVDHL